MVAVFQVSAEYSPAPGGDYPQAVVVHALHLVGDGPYGPWYSEIDGVTAVAYPAPGRQSGEVFYCSSRECIFSQKKISESNLITAKIDRSISSASNARIAT
jgi:hypothetical protein